MDVNTASQSTTDEQMMDILLVLDKEKKTISAVKGVDENGELQTVPPEDNSELLKFDRHGDFFSNFFSNMMNQLKNPTRFNFFKIPKIELPKIEPIIRDNFNHPTPENEAGIERYRVTPETVKQEAKKEQQETQAQQPQQPAKEAGAMAQTPQQPDKSKYVIDPDKVDWEALKNFGLSKEQLEKAKALEPMLRGYKSPGAFTIAGNYNSAIMKLDARLSFRHDKDGNVVLAIHGIRQKPELERPFFGHEFSKEDKANLLETGNMGRIVNLKNYITGEMIPSFVSVDKVTNELVSMRASSVQIPDEIKGVKLSKEQQQALREGKGVFLENMISNRKNPFSATVQVNADKKSLEFIYPNAKQSQEQRQKLEQQNNLVTSDGVTIPKSISGIELTRQQQQDLVNDKTIFVAGLKDKRGVEYDAYKDSGMEIYARLMQMRKDLALDADKVFTLEDVAAMRRKCMEKRAAYEKQQKEKDNAAKVLPDGADALPGGAAVLSEEAAAMPEAATVLSEEAAAMPEQMKLRQDIGEIYDGLAPQDIDTMIFERYSDEQIMHLLNDVSDLDKPGNEAVKGMSRDALFDGMKRDFAMAAAGERVKTHIAREKVAVGNVGGTVVRQDTKQTATEPEEKRTEKAAFDAAIWRGRNEKYYS